MPADKKCQIWFEGFCKNAMDVNASCGLGTYVAGFGYTYTEGILSCIGIPYITDKTFKYHQEQLLEQFK